MASRNLLTLIVLNLLLSGLFVLAEITNQTLNDATEPLIREKDTSLMTSTVIECDCSIISTIANDCRAYCDRSDSSASIIDANPGKKFNYVPLVVILVIVAILSALTYIPLYLRNRREIVISEITLNQVKISERNDQTTEVTNDGQENKQDKSNIIDGKLEEVSLNQDDHFS